MISKKKALIGGIILVIITSIATLTIGNYIGLRLGDNYLISKEYLEQYREIEEDFSKVIFARDFLLENYYQELDKDVLMEGAVEGIFNATDDPYTVYMSPSEYESFTTETEGSFGGIGIIVTPGDDGFVTIVSPIEGTPGDRAGLRTGDKILQVDGQDIEGRRLDKAVDLMRGEPGTEVEIVIRREDQRELIEITIEREIIKIETVQYELMEDQLGYIRITNFNQQTARDFRGALESLERQDMEGLVLDLRNNPGGLLNQTIQIADMLLDEQVIVYTEDRDGTRREQRSNRSHVDVPLTVLVNRGSASASEILAGAVQDGGRGLIIGETTFGKALVQSIQEFDEDGSAFRYTVSQYFTPSGNNIQDAGIEPDIEISLDEDVRVDQIEDGMDFQLDRAIEELLKALEN